jgi:hypothetical protein
MSPDSMANGLRLRSTLICPYCGHAETLTMPRDACVVRHDCARSRAAMRPKPGDCCVFCSYGDAPCPPAQADNTCCAGPK